MKTLLYLILFLTIISCNNIQEDSCNNECNLFVTFQNKQLSFNAEYQAYNEQCAYRIKGYNMIGIDQWYINLYLVESSKPVIQSYEIHHYSFNIQKGNYNYIGYEGVINITSVIDHRIYGDFNGKVQELSTNKIYNINGIIDNVFY